MEYPTVDWNNVLVQTLDDILGKPLTEDHQNMRWKGKESSKGDQSRSFTYTKEGKYQGCWRDWSTDTGGKDPIKFVMYWNGWDKKQALGYLIQRGFLQERNWEKNFDVQLGTKLNTVTYTWETLTGVKVNQYRFEYAEGKDVRWAKGKKPDLHEIYYPATLTRKMHTLVVVEGAKCAHIANEFFGMDVFTLINSTTVPSRDVLMDLIVKQNYSQILFWPDNDRPARAIARQIAHNLLGMAYQGAIKFVNSFSLPSRGDAVDDVEKPVAMKLLGDAEEFIPDLTEGLNKDRDRDNLQWQEARYSLKGQGDCGVIR